MQTVLRSLVVVLTVSLLESQPVSAALNLEAPGSYTPGEIIMITVTGDSEGAKSGGMRVILTIEETLALVGVERGSLHSSDPDYEEWIHTPASGTCGSGLAPNQCLAVDAFIDYTGPPPIDLLPSTLTTWRFDTTNATGDLLFVLQPDGAGFFGLPGTEATVVQIPEPASAALVAAGLLTLAASRRRVGRR